MEQFDDAKRRIGMKYSTYDGMFASMMDALTSAFLSAFALALGAGNVMIGLLSSIPQVLWTANQLTSAWAIERTGKRKKIAVLSALLSRLIWLPIAFLPFLFPSLTMLILLVSLSTMIGAFTGPAWASWMADIVPDEIRGTYFSNRNRATALAGLVATISAGLFLDIFPKGTTVGFTIIFIAGVICGAISASFLAKMPEPPYAVMKTKFSESVRHAFRNRRFRKFIVIYFIFRFGVMFGAPFMVVDLINNMHAAYIWISITAAASTIAGILARGSVGKVSDMFGHRPVLIIGIVGTALTPLGWAFATAPEHIIFVNIINGIAWAAADLALFNYLLETSPREKRATYAALFWIVMGAAAILAPIAGGFYGDYMAGKTFLGFQGLKAVFIVSFFLRLAAGLLFWKFLEEVVEKREKAPTVEVAQEMFRTGIHGGINQMLYIKSSAERTARKVEGIVESVEKELKEVAEVVGERLEEMDEERQKAKEEIVRGVEEIEKKFTETVEEK
ncbi:MAG: MFS transporter, partial [Candidatus Aenigmarchaeota archaeon]|nr:MFS transporter [Candidatus Aenigmarchaeota archaeon]MDI6722855.1 MFS transporter [Candidatus Aenigmarchaeota archaeon]